MKATIRLGIAILCAGALLACGDDGYTDPPTGDSGVNVRDAGDASTLADRPTMIDGQVNPEGPDITINAPVPLQVLSGNQVEVKATITDEDGVDDSSVYAEVPGGATYPLTRGEGNAYKGFVNLLDQPSGNMTIRVVAADVNEMVNSAEVQVERDTGPVVTFYSPLEGKPYAGSTNLSFKLDDLNGVQESSVVARIGAVELPLVKQEESGTHNGVSPTQISFTAEIVFDDVMFDPPLDGEQQIVVTAENILNSVQSTSTVNFIVDRDGPEIVVLTPSPGEIVGGILTIEAEVNDPSGVQTSSVVAVLANNSVQYVVPLTSSGGSPFTGDFDTRAFPHNWIFPSLSIRAADSLNNESEVGFLMALDNTAPIASLDPPPDFHLARENTDGFVECSYPFDPVGAGVPDDGTRVPQVFFLRARIEDRGNNAVGLVQVPISLVDQSTTELYVLDDTDQALVVDTDGDGYCDEINPEVRSGTTPQTPVQALILNLAAIDPAGDADYREPGAGSYYHAYYGTIPALPAGCDQWGTESDEPNGLCTAVDPDGFSPVPFQRSIFYTVDKSEPAIYTLPYVSGSDPLFCTGQQFDSLANNISEGWACAAVRVKDNAGNIGVSRPLRFFIDYTLDGAPVYVPSAIPNCTGTWDGAATDSTAHCIFDTATQDFPANAVRRED